MSYDQLFAPGNLIAYLYIGALTGIFEAGVAWLILRKVRSGKANWNQALVFGIGFGVIEALLLGFASLGSALGGLLAPDMLPIYTLGSFANNTNIAMGLAPVVERLSVIFAHIFSCVLIFHAIASREAKWGWLAILYKTLLDAPGGFAAFWGMNTVNFPCANIKMTPIPKKSASSCARRISFTTAARSTGQCIVGITGAGMSTRIFCAST